MYRKRHFNEYVKTLLQRLFGSFMTLFFPELAARLDLTQVEFLPAESFVRPPRGRRKYPDIVAKVGLRGGGAAVLVIHLEIQERPDPTLPARMHRYYVVLRDRFRCPVLPIALLFHGPRGAAGIGEAEYVEETLGKAYLRFTYHQIVVPRLPAEDYLAQENPVGLALAARMRRGRKLTGGDLVLTVLGKLVDSSLSEEDLGIIWDFVRSYVKLTPEEETKVNEAIEQEQKKGKRPRLTWSQQERLKGLAEGRVEGLAEGRVEGLAEGQQQALTLLLTQKFGPLPKGVQTRIRTLSVEDLQTTLTQVLAAQSLADLGLVERPRRTTRAASSR